MLTTLLERFIAKPQWRLLLLILCVIFFTAAQTQQSESTIPKVAFNANASYQLCFVPDGASCQQLLVDSINAAQKSIRVQAYSFTNSVIAKALIDAKNRGVNVQVIVDKSQHSERYSIVTLLINAQIDVYIDIHPAIAHNKVMIFDNASVFTGSFNFTKAAQQKNAENGLLINDANLAQQYADNWQKRLAVSVAPWILCQSNFK